jgi:hypothetical protein
MHVARGTTRILLLGVVLLLSGGLAGFAGQERVNFPASYKSGVLYAMSDRPDDKTVRDLYASAENAVTGERQIVDTKPCFECHQPQASEDYLYTLRQLQAAAKK